MTTIRATEQYCYEDTFGWHDDMCNDPKLRFLYHKAFFDSSLKSKVVENYQSLLDDYCWDEYEFAFDFDCHAPMLDERGLE